EGRGVILIIRVPSCQRARGACRHPVLAQEIGYLFAQLSVAFPAAVLSLSRARVKMIVAYFFQITPKVRNSEVHELELLFFRFIDRNQRVRRYNLRFKIW